MNRDGARKSVWQDQIRSFSVITPQLATFDVVIVGGGITGVSTALALQKAGKKCLLVEAANIAFGTSGGTTAHLNDFFDTSFAQAIKNFGLEKAKLFAAAGKDAMAVINNNIDDYGIRCDFEEKNAQLFALDDKQAHELDEMVKAAAQVHYQMKYISSINFPIPFKKAVEISRQAQFHPLKYIKALAEEYMNLGGVIFEGCICREHNEKDGSVIVETSNGTFTAQQLVYATHIPPGINKLHFTNAPYRSYVLACTLNDENYPDVLGYDLQDPYHYYRTHTVNGKKLLIAGGEDHKTGHADNTGECFSNLENYVRSHYNVDKVMYSWSSQYYEPVDGFPYIGVLPGSNRNVFVATGFRGNGMMFGSLSSKIISDLILQGSSSYEELFSPARIKPVAGFTQFVKEQTTVVTDFIKDKFFSERIESFAAVDPGNAKVVKYENENYAVYKEVNGKTHILKSTCPHAKCEVRWNSAEISWDCPCHGSRFNVNGKLLTAPAVNGLQKINEDKL